MSITASPLRPPRDRIRSLAPFSTPVIADACEDPKIMTDLEPVRPSMRLLGCAFTVKMYPGDNLSCHVALKRSREGDVLVIDAGGRRDRAPWGGLMSENAARKNLEGVVVDGVVRDREVLLEGDFPVFSRGFHPRGTRKEAVCELNTPVVCGNTRVRPGDVVVGDGNGILVVPPGRVKSVAKKAAEIREREDRLANQIRAGEDLFELLEIDPAAGKGRD